MTSAPAIPSTISGVTSVVGEGISSTVTSTSKLEGRYVGKVLT